MWTRAERETAISSVSERMLFSVTASSHLTDATAVASDAWLRLAEAAELAGLSRATMDRAAVRGEIPFAVLAGIRYFRPDDVRRWARWRARSG